MFHSSRDVLYMRGGHVSRLFLLMCGSSRKLLDDSDGVCRDIFIVDYYALVRMRRSDSEREIVPLSEERKGLPVMETAKQPPSEMQEYLPVDKLLIETPITCSE